MNDLSNLYHIADNNDITVDCFKLEKREALSVMDEDGSCFIAIDPFQVRSDQDEKLKLAHEIGHCMTSAFYNFYSDSNIRQKEENKADKWAIEHLISKEELEDAVAEGNTEIWQLAEYFNVTETFMRKAVCWYKHGNLAVDLYMAV